MVQDRFPHLPLTWLGPVASAVPERPWPPGVLGYDLYTGRVGPALALATLGMGVEDPRYVQAARAVLDPAVSVLAEQQYELRSVAQAGVGAYSGFAGTLWSIAQAGDVLDEPIYHEAARHGLRLLVIGEPEQPRWFDLITGEMGTLLVRMSLHDPDAPPRAVAACEYALKHGVVQAMEYSGLAHGLAGLLLFASRTHVLTGATVAAELAAAVDRELARTFRTARGHFRTNRTGEENYSDSWCNGSAGLLLGQAEAVRAGLLEPDGLVEILDDIRAESMSTSLTLCHGMLGLYDALDDLPGDAGPIGQDLRARIAGYLSPERIKASLESPDVRYNQSPCLMVGQAGIVWHVAGRLQASRPGSPLTLAPVR